MTGLLHGRAQTPSSRAGAMPESARPTIMTSKPSPVSGWRAPPSMTPAMASSRPPMPISAWLASEPSAQALRHATVPVLFHQAHVQSASRSRPTTTTRLLKARSVRSAREGLSDIGCRARCVGEGRQVVTGEECRARVQEEERRIEVLMAHLYIGFANIGGTAATRWWLMAVRWP